MDYPVYRKLAAIYQPEIRNADVSELSSASLNRPTMQNQAERIRILHGQHHVTRRAIVNRSVAQTADLHGSYFLPAREQSSDACGQAVESLRLSVQNLSPLWMTAR